MKLYILSSNPKLAAEWHMDSHVAGMCGVYNQLVSNAYHIHEDALPATISFHKLDRYEENSLGEKTPVYQIEQQMNKEDFLSVISPPHDLQHPVSKWIADSHGNFAMTLMLCDSLHREYYKRFGKTIGSSNVSVLCNKAQQSLPTFKDDLYHLTYFPVKPMRGIEIPKEATILKNDGSKFVFIKDVNSMVRQLQDQYKREVADELKRSKKRLKDLYTNRTPPPFLSSLEKIIIS